VMVTSSVHRRQAMSHSAPQSVHLTMKLQSVAETEYVAKLSLVKWPSNTFAVMGFLIV